MLFEVTDPFAPSECALSDAHFTDVGGGHVLAFNETITSERRYVLTPLDKIHEIPSADVVSDVPSGYIGHPLENGVDILVISHANYVTDMQRWVDWRASQGYKVLMADAQDLYDEFNGGVANPRGIKKFIKRFVELGGASFVVLVGDASEDNKRVHLESAVNFVPTESFTEHVLGGGFDEDEVVTTDKWYTMLNFDFINEAPPNGFPDFYPDVIIGRLPAGTTNELRVFLDKTIEFERVGADQLWRRRMIRIADDDYSGGNTLCRVPVEAGFQLAEERCATTTEQSIPGGFDVVRFFL
jgi:hypothetical protein